MVTTSIEGRRRNLRTANPAFEAPVASEEAIVVNEPCVLYDSLLAMAKASIKAGYRGDGKSQTALFPDFYARAHARRVAQLSNERRVSLAEHRVPTRPRFEQSVLQPPWLETNAHQSAKSAPGTQAYSASEIETGGTNMANPAQTCYGVSTEVSAPEIHLEDAVTLCKNTSFVHGVHSSESHGEPDESCGLQWTTTCPLENPRKVNWGGGRSCSTGTQKRPRSAFATLYSVLKEGDVQDTVGCRDDVGFPPKGTARQSPSANSGRRRPNSAMGHGAVAVAQLRAQPRLGVVGKVVTTLPKSLDTPSPRRCKHTWSAQQNGRYRDARPPCEELVLRVDRSIHLLDRQQDVGAARPSSTPAWSTRFRMRRVSKPTRLRPPGTGSTPHEPVGPMVVAVESAAHDSVVSLPEVADTVVESPPVEEEQAMTSAETFVNAEVIASGNKAVVAEVKDLQDISLTGAKNTMCEAGASSNCNTEMEASRMSINTSGDSGRPPLVHRGTSSSSRPRSRQACRRPQAPEAVLSAHRELRRASSSGAEMGAVLELTVADTGDTPESLKQRLCELRRAQAALQGMGRSATVCVSHRTFAAVEHKMQLLSELADCTASYREVALKRDHLLQAIESNVGGETEEPQLGMAARLDSFLQTSTANCTKRSSARPSSASTDKRGSSHRLHSSCVSGLPRQHIAVVQAQVLLQQEGHAWAVEVLARAKTIATTAKETAQCGETNEHLPPRSSSNGSNSPPSVIGQMVALATKLGAPKEHPHLQDAWKLAVELRLAELQQVLQAQQFRAVRAAGRGDRGEAHIEAASCVEAAVRAASDFGVSWEQLGPFANAAMDLRAEAARRLVAGQVEYSCGRSKAVCDASVQRANAAIEAAFAAGVPKDHQAIKEASRLVAQIREDVNSCL